MSRCEILLRTKGSCALELALRLQYMACASSRREDVGGRILRIRRKDCVPSVELRRRLCLTSIPALLAQRRLRWFGHAARRPEGELIKDLPLPTPPRTWRRRAGGQLKTLANSKADLEHLSGPQVFGNARWGKDWVKVSSELAQDRRAWRASVRDVVNSIRDADSTRHGWMPTQAQVSTCVGLHYLLLFGGTTLVYRLMYRWDHENKWYQNHLMRTAMVV